MGKDNKLITPHAVYKSLGINGNSCQPGYRDLFKHHISTADVKGIREATNKAWVLGSDRFKEKVEQLMDRQVQAKPRGGDRKSKAFKEKDDINRV